MGGQPVAIARVKNRSGFTLVEVVIAMMIGTIGLLALSGMLAKVMENNRRATDLSIATALARQKIEQIKITEYNYVTNESEYYLNASGEVVPSGVDAGKYTRVTEVQNDVPASNTKTVDVTVYFSPSISDTLKMARVSTIIYP